MGCGKGGSAAARLIQDPAEAADLCCDMTDPTKKLMKTNLIIDDLDEEILSKARKYASTRGKTLEELVEEFLTQFADGSGLDPAAKDDYKP